MDKDSDFRITTNYKNSDNRNVLNTKEIPEYLKLNTHFREERGDLKNYEKYDSLEFSEKSFNFMAPEEDEEILSGKVKPIVKGTGSPKRDEKIINNVLSEMGIEEVGDKDNDYPLDDWDINNTEAVISRPSSSTNYPDFLYSPVVLVVLLLIFVSLIVLEVLGMVFLLR